MGIATFLLSLLFIVLDAFVSFVPDTRASRTFPDEFLRVLIKHDEAKPNLEHEADDLAIAPKFQESEPDVKTVTANREATPIAPSESPATQRSPIDWNRAIAESVAPLANEKRKQIENRDAMWQQTHSVMFQPTNEIFNGPAPLLAELRFKPEIHVLGLGLKIGSCFIGLPFVGVPVEDRTAAIRLFACADDSG